MSARGGKVLRGWLLVTIVFGLIGACVFPPEAVHGPCLKDTDCPDDGNPCTKGVCDVATGFCKGEPQDLPFGDPGCDDKNPCTDEICSAGVCAHKPSTLSPSDGNECTDDACVNGTASHDPIADGTSCGLGGMLQCVGGTCKCTTATECGQSTECLKFECTNSQCKSTSLEAGTLIDGKAPGDCLKNVCDGANQVITAPDLADVPADPTPGNCKKKACDAMLGVIDVDDPMDVPPSDSEVCTNEGCNGGVPILNVPVANGTACGNAATCGPTAGGGFQATPNDACSNGACAANAIVDCDYYRCNAANTACLTACVDGNDCIVGAFCDPMTNTCKPVAGSGNSCMTAAECGSGFCVDGVCCNGQCNGLCERCNDPAKNGFCTPIPSGQDPTMECPSGAACNGAGGCKKSQGEACALDADCLTAVCEDNVCCNVACGGPCKRCDIAASNGTCGNVAKDAEAAGCMSPKACDGAGVCKTQSGKPCGSDAECMSGFCQDGVCCNNDCMGTCARCDLPASLGICTNVGVGQQVSGCNVANACDGSNNCKKVNGQACALASECVSGFCVDEDLATAGVQGVCCNAICTETCKSCSAAKTVGGGTGVCDFIKNKSDPDGECTVMNASCNASNGKACCNGAGVCNPP